MRKFLSITLILALMLTLFTGCHLTTNIQKIVQPAEKTFSKSGMSITLTEQFAEKEHVSYTSVYESKDIAIFTLKEEFSLFGGADYSVKEYAELVIEANKLTSDVKTQDDLTYFDYDKEINGKDFQYTAFVYKADDAYWMIQFACAQDDADALKDEVFKYARSVKV